MSTYTVSVLINGSAAGYRRAMQEGERATRGFVANAQREFNKLRQFMTTAQGQLAGVGLSVGWIQMQRHAAQLEKQLTQVSLTAGMTQREQADAYKAMFEMVKRNGGVIEETVGSFNSLIQAGLKYKEAMNATEAINVARAVTGADANLLANALTIGAANFNIDLSKMGAATLMLDKMTVSGRLGNAELENLSSILPKVASGAQRAGMDFDKTLAFVQALSLSEKQPERLATLADSTTRLFTNMNYSKDAEKALGIPMFDAKGARRDPVSVLEDMRKKYLALKTDAERFKFMGSAFGKTDLDTQRGISNLMLGEVLAKMREFERISKSAGGTLDKDLDRATNNAVAQAERLKNTLRHAAEDFARPINDAVTRSIRYLLDKKEKGGLGLSGGDIAAGAVIGAGGLYALSRFLPPLMGKLLGRAGGVGAGVATGKALEAAAGITPVYVTNWAEMNGGSTASAIPGAAGGAAGAAASMGKLGWAGGIGLAAVGGYAAGSLLYKGVEETAGANRIGEVIAKVLAVFGNNNAQEAVAINEALSNSRVGGEVTVRVEGNPNLAVQAEVRPFNGTRMRADVGQTNRAAGY